VEYCTAGVLLRRLVNDPGLDGISAVVVDEVHERALDTDLSVAMLAELRMLRPELKLVVMSATLDAERWSHLLGGAPTVQLEAELHPLEVHWAPLLGAPRLDAHGVSDDFLAHLAEQALAVLDEHSVLVFAPGARECERVAELVRSRGAEAWALHGSLDSRAQDRVLHDTQGPRVVVATSVAESSLTVPGVRAVVDSGLSREPRLDRARGMTGLVTLTEARSSAEQRAGRAARLGPGVVVRCFPEAEWAGMRASIAPEIQTADLTQTVLDLAVWGTPRGADLALPDPLPNASVGEAEGRLVALGALDAEGRVTDLGRRLAALPLDPRLGRALLVASCECGSQETAEVLALLTGQERAQDADLVGLWRRMRRDNPSRWRHEADRLATLVHRPSALPKWTMMSSSPEYAPPL